MYINDVLFNAELTDIISELQNQLRLNNIDLLKSTKDGPDNIQVSCPYHNNGQENRPSAGIRKSDGVIHCFACGETHTLPEMISHCFGQYDDYVGSYGWQWLLKNFLTVSVDERPDIDLDIDRNKTVKITQDYVSEDILDTYRYTHPYMYKRRLTDPIIDLFDIGYDKGSKCITFPVRDIAGNCLFVARRSVEKKFFNYPQGVEKPVYGLYELYKYARKEFNCIDTHIMYDFPKEVIICESMLNCTTCWVYGKFAVALNGTGTPYQYKQLLELPVRKFILALDPDDAGKRGREKLKKALKGKLVTEYVIPVGKDVNDLTKEEFDNLQEIM